MKNHFYVITGTNEAFIDEFLKYDIPDNMEVYSNSKNNYYLGISLTSLNALWMRIQMIFDGIKYKRKLRLKKLS